MKKAFSLFGLSVCLLAFACNSPSGSSTGAATDSSKVIPPPSSNSDATNSSAADTSYPKKDTMTTKGDSMRREK